MGGLQESRFRGSITPTESSAIYLDLAQGFKETSFDNTNYLYVPWREMGFLNFNLIQQITASEERFDRIIALSRGGLTMARDLSDGLGIDELSSMRYKRYDGVNRAGPPTLVEDLPESVKEKIKGEKVLVVDEVLDEGTTMQQALEDIKKLIPKNITVASIAYKPRSVVKPRFYALQTTDWIVFPHEHREFIQDEALKWLTRGLDIENIRSRFIEIGIPKAQVNFYLNNFWKNFKKLKLVV